MPFDSLLIAITPDSLSEELLIEQCRAAEDGGATSIQVRLKARATNTVFEIARTLVSAMNIPVYVNDRIDIALAAGAAGVHVGANDLPSHRIRFVAPKPFRVGVSVGSPEEAVRALLADADYWSIGPFASTPTKDDAGSALGPSGFAALARMAPLGTPVVAIGGMDARTSPIAITAGATGVAAVSALFGPGDVREATRILRRSIDQALASRRGGSAL